MPTDTSERGIERLICTALAGHPCEPPAAGTVAEPPAGYGGVGWSGGNFHDYDREHCVDLVQLSAFLKDDISRKMVRWISRARPRANLALRQPYSRTGPERAMRNI